MRPAFLALAALLASMPALAQGVDINGRFGATTAWVDAEPPGPPRAPRVGGAITITNRGDEALTFTFGTSQRFELSLIDSNGEIVRQWSDNKAFLMVVSTETLRPGESWTFRGAVPLKDGDGRAVRAGDYTLRIELTSTPEEGTTHGVGSYPMSVESPLKVGWAL